MSWLNYCDRCGSLLVKHYHPQNPGRWTGCPHPVGYDVPKATCGFQGCTSEQDDPVLGLCPRHQQQAAVITDPRPRSQSKQPWGEGVRYNS